MKCPAISPARSSSRLVSPAADEDDELGTAARAILDASSTSQRLHDFIRQPFHVAAPWTGRPGESTDLDQAVRQAHAVP